MKKFSILLFVGILALVFLMYAAPRFLWSRRSAALAPGDVQISGALFHTEVVSDQESRERGLSGRAGLPENGGMLFLFPEAGSYSFWMKDMRFPIDIVWIASGTVVFIAERVPPPRTLEESPAVVTPTSAADMVLEVQSGSVHRFGIVVGSSVTIHVPSSVTVR